MSVEVARCRLVLSAVAMGLLLGDAAGAGRAAPIAAALIVIATHFALASAIVAMAGGGLRDWCARIAPWFDAAFAVALPIATASTHTPFFAFALFAVVATALDGRTHDALIVTTACIAVYLFHGVRGEGSDVDLAMMRVAALAILGYLVVRLAHRRVRYDAALRVRDGAVERERLARRIHDGCAALLAALDIRLEADRELVREGRHAEAAEDLALLRHHVRAELEDVRAYSRRLAAVDPGANAAPSAIPARVPPRITLDVRCDGPPEVLDEVLAILRESLRNVACHADASNATLRVRVKGAEIVVDVVDDGLGFPEGAQAPWSIASRVADLGGRLRMPHEGMGAHLSISLPRP